MAEAVTKIGQIKKRIKKTKILSPIQITENNKDQLRQTAKQSEMGQAIVQTYPDLDFKEFDHEKFVQIRAAFLTWLNSKTVDEVYTLIELENLLKVMKFDISKRLHRKIAAEEDFDKTDWDRMKQVFEHLTNLHKLKHGEKHGITKIDFKDIRDMYSKGL